MTAIEKIVERCRKYPGLRWTVEPDTIDVLPATSNGFNVWLTIKNPGFTVGFEGWHEEFDDENEALNCVAFGLSDSCRLKVVQRGSRTCSWTVESKNGAEWVADSTTGLLFVPVWKKKRIIYKQNAIIPSTSAQSANL